MLIKEGHRFDEVQRKRRSFDPDSRPEPPSKKVPKIVHSADKPKPRVENTVASLSGEAKPIEAAKKEETVAGQYKLNPLLSRVLESELQDVMIKVWQEFPDKPASRAETVVVDKLRYEAGDDLRNTLGLNVTKRLLNVFNKLFVQIHFPPNKVPEKHAIEEFIKKYNVKSFRHLEGRSGNIYVAELKSIKDFDLLCSQDKRIDDWRVLAVKPCYRFMDCPPNLNCIFSPGSGKKNKGTPKKNVENRNQDADNASPVKDNKRKINEPITQIAKVSAAKEVKKVEDAKINVKGEIVKKDKENRDKPLTKKTKVEEKVTKTVEPNQASGKIGVKDAKSNNVNINKPSQKKPTVDKEKAVKDVSENKDKPLQRTPNKPNAERTKTEAKLAAKPKQATKPPVTKKLTNSERKTQITSQDDEINTVDDDDDDEELNDEEILKLLSGGIVIDECSGSDQE